MSLNSLHGYRDQKSWIYQSSHVYLRLIHCQKKGRRQDVLSVAGLVLIFFIAPRFGFVTKTESIRHRCSGCCWAVLVQHQGFGFPTLSQQGGWGSTRNWESTRLGQLTTESGYSMLFNAMLRHKSSGGGGGCRDNCGYGNCLSTWALRVLRPDFQGSGSTSPCQWEIVNECPILLCLNDFASPIKCLYLPAFALVILSPILLGHDWVTWVGARTKPPQKYRRGRQKCGSKMIFFCISW